MNNNTNERPTPITDRKEGLFDCSACGTNVVSADFARDLERQLAEALEKIERQGDVTATASLDPMMERALTAEKRLCEALVLAESNGKLAHDTAIELREARKQRDRLATWVECLLDRMILPPDPNCSCHISPPCDDCVEYSGLREAVEETQSALAAMKGETNEPR